MNELIVACLSAFVFFGIFTLLLRYFTDRRPSSTAHAMITDENRGSTRSVSVKGLPREEISTLPIFPYSSFKDLEIGKGSKTECPVCLGEFAENESVRLLPKCDHAFHPQCIENWLLGTGTCPVCRTDLTVESSGDWAERKEGVTVC